MLGGIDGSSQRGISCSSVFTGLINEMDKGTIFTDVDRNGFPIVVAVDNVRLLILLRVFSPDSNFVAKFVDRMREKTSSVFKSSGCATLLRNCFHFLASESHGFKSFFVREPLMIRSNGNLSEAPERSIESVRPSGGSEEKREFI